MPEEKKYFYAVLNFMPWKAFRVDDKTLTVDHESKSVGCMLIYPTLKDAQKECPDHCEIMKLERE
jgi:hypothetical protein